MSFEALICWDHPKFGLVSPSLFIPIAEEDGLITEIGDWVLQKVCSDFNHISKINKDITMCVNISSRQLLQEKFYSRVKEVINEYNLAPERMVFELTESAVMSYTDGPFKTTITKLHELGVKISIDDFGTGYSSLVRLKHLPIHTLKIEKSFVQDAVRDVNGAIIVNCLIALGNNLDLNVVAEGIETEEELQFLISKNCPQGQGYYLSKPLRDEDVIKLLHEEMGQKTDLK